MNYIRKIALFIGVGTTVAMTPFAVQAQTCANSSQTPLTKSRLDQIATNQGIPLSQVGVKFERFALNTLKPGNPIASNRRLFPSPLRQIKAGIGNVQPDGVVPLVVNLIPFFSFTYPDSVFYESKAVRGTLLPPSYEKYQILGFLDVLDRSSATANNENPAIVFLTTSDVRTISSKTIAEANRRGIGVWHSIGCEIAPPSGNLQMGKAQLLNVGVYTALPAVMQYSFLLTPLLSSLSAFRMYLIAAGSAVSFQEEYLQVMVAPETLVEFKTIYQDVNIFCQRRRYPSRAA